MMIIIPFLPLTFHQTFPEKLQRAVRKTRQYKEKDGLKEKLQHTAKGGNNEERSSNRQVNKELRE